MEFNALENIEKIASKLKVKNRKQRLTMAREINELAKIIIEWKTANYEQRITLHKSIV